MTQNPFDNQDFRDELGKVLDQKLSPFTKFTAMVEQHEAALNRAKGARWAIGLLWAGVTIVGEWLFHRGR